MPLESDGATIFAETRTPTQDELDECKHFHLTSQTAWNPDRVKLPQARWSIAEDRLKRLSKVEVVPGDSTTDDDEDELFNIDGFNRRVCSSVRVESIPRKVKRVSAVEFQGPTTPNTFVSTERRSDVSPEGLSNRWMIGLEQAKLTLKHTTQMFVRTAMLPLSRRYKADRIHRLPRLQGEWFTDTVDGRTKSRDGNRYGQIFANGAYFATIYPMDSKAKAGDALRVFCKEFGVPETLRFDGSKEQTGRNTEFTKQIRKHNIDFKISEPELHNQSPAEGVVREVRRRWYRVMFKKRVPEMFWDYGMRWVCETMNRTYV